MSLFKAFDLLEAGRAFHEENDPMPEYRDLVLAGQGRPPAGRLDDAIAFLRIWKALRFKGGANKARQILTPWLPNCESTLHLLDSKLLENLGFQDFYNVFWLFANLRDSGLPPTASGKLLHFLLPNAILLWDKEIVRSRYQLGDDPSSFLSYQCYGQKLLHYLSKQGSLGDIQEDHAINAGCKESLAKLIDELAYSPKLLQRAVEALGGRLVAFQLPLPSRA